MDIMCALIGIHGFEVLCVPHHMIFALNAIAAVHVSRDPGDIKRLTAIVPFDDGNHLWRHLVLIH